MVMSYLRSSAFQSYDLATADKNGMDTLYTAVHNYVPKYTMAV